MPTSAERSSELRKLFQCQYNSQIKKKAFNTKQDRVSDLLSKNGPTRINFDPAQTPDDLKFRPITSNRNCLQWQKEEVMYQMV